MRNLHRKRLIGNLILTIAVVAAAIVLYLLAGRFAQQWDLTQTSSNSLESASIDILKQLPGPIKLTVYATGQDARMGDVHRVIRDFVSLYQRYKPDIALDFIDPVKQPDEARKSGIQVNGEMVVEYENRNLHLTLINEQSLTSALLSLAHSKNQLVMYVEGHGERRLEGVANHDLGEFGNKLKQNGFRLAPVNLALAQDVPGNAGVLVITQPQMPLLQGEITKLIRYIARGGNLLWLVDAEPLQGLERIAEKLGLLLTPGVIIDPESMEMNAPATWALASGYPPHAITQNFDLITIFPFARSIDWEEDNDWHHTIVVEAAPRGWVSRTLPKDKARFDKNHDIPGPATVALALEREVNDREQRIVIVGSGSFLANAYSGNGGNLDLGVNIVNWLANEENLITIQPRSAKDNTITLSKTRLAVISNGFLIAMPGLLVGIGLMSWWRRRR